MTMRWVPVPGGGFALGTAEGHRRQVAVRLTDAGAQRLTAERRARASVIAGALRERLSPEERAVAARIPLILSELT